MTTALEGGEGSASRPGCSLPPGKTRYPLYRRLRGSQGRSGQVQKISPPTGIRSPDRPVRSTVAIPTVLAGPLYAQRIGTNLDHNWRLHRLSLLPEAMQLLRRLDICVSLGRPIFDPRPGCVGLWWTKPQWDRPSPEYISTNIHYAWFQASVAKWMRSALFWDNR